MRHQFSSNVISISNSYDIHRHDRNGHGGDAAMFANTKLDQKRLHTAQTFTEIVRVQICTPHIITIFCIYIPPKDNRHICISYLNSLLTTYTDRGRLLLVMSMRTFCMKVSKNIHTTF